MRYLQLWPRIGEKTAEKIVRIISERPGTSENIVELLREELGAAHPGAIAFEETMGCYMHTAECVRSAAAALRPLLSQRYDHWLQRAKDLELLEQVARNYRSVSQFIDDFTLEPMNDTQIANEHNDDAVTLITVHSAKGTEARICFIASATQSNYPHFRSLGDRDAEEEERRVLYVACTRAKDELVITRSAMNRNAFWVAHSPAVGEPYFLQDLPEQLVARNLHGWSERPSGGLGGLRDIY
jgi:DNA helicase-2/ATP-dependent DNA helicase PcrA